MERVSLHDSKNPNHPDRVDGPSMFGTLGVVAETARHIARLERESIHKICQTSLRTSQASPWHPRRHTPSAMS